MTTTSDTAETYVVQRYEPMWGDWRPTYGYKHVKGARLARIILDTGGLTRKALELGVGPGGIAAVLSKRGINVIGMDLSANALQRAKEHCRGENVSLMRGSGFQLPFRAASLPLVYASQVLHLFDDPGRLALMREVHRVLEPGGRFVFDMKNASSHFLRVLFRYSAERRRRNFPPQSAVLELLQQAGFSSIRRMPGVLPLVRFAGVPNSALARALSHTTFFVATRQPAGRA